MLPWDSLGGRKTLRLRQTGKSGEHSKRTRQLALIEGASFREDLFSSSR